MSLDPRAWRPSPLLPRARGAGAMGLFLAGALMSVAAVMAMAWLSADLRARPTLRARLSGGTTVAVMASRTAGDLESLDAAAWRAREALATLPGVASARVLASAPEDMAIAAAMGAGGAPSRLIAVVFTPGAAPASLPKMSAMMGALSREGLAAAADDHDPVTGPVERALTLDAAGLAVTGAVLLGLLAALTGAMTQERARRLAPRITLLSGLGMTNGALLAQLLRPVALNAALASITGAAAALAVMGLAAPRLAGLGPLIPAPGALDFILAAGWPVLATVLALLAAAMVGLGRLRQIAP